MEKPVGNLIVNNSNPNRELIASGVRCNDGQIVLGFFV